MAVCRVQGYLVNHYRGVQKFLQGTSYLYHEPNLHRQFGGDDGGEDEHAAQHQLVLRPLPLPKPLISDFEFRISSFGFRVSGFGFRVSGLGCRV